MAREDTRQLLIETGTRLILERGFNHTGVQEVLKEAGKPKGSFYHHFATKEEFGLTILQQYFERLISVADQFLGDTSRPPVERLDAYFRHYIEHFRERGCRDGCLLGNLSQELADQSPVFRDRLNALLDAWTGKVADCLTEALGEPAEARRLASFCLNSFEGALCRMKAAKSVEPLEEFMAVVFGRLLK